MPPKLSAAEIQVLDFINATFDAILSELSKQPFGKPQIVLQRITSFDVTFNYAHQKLERQILSHEACYSWPGRNRDEAWRFTCVGRILGEIKLALESRRVVTKRDIYYRDPNLFKNQHIVDRYIDDIAYTCNVKRSDLSVSASPHGLYVGMNRDDGMVRSISEKCLEELESIDHLKWVLVVEKEATFKQLAEQRLYNDCSLGAGLLVTGRGYPDLSTQRFIHSLSARTNSVIPTFGLFDADPDGLAILNCYRYGSKVSAQELEHTAIKFIWLGVKLNDVENADLIPLTMHDRVKAKTMLDKSTDLRDLPDGIDHCDMLQQILMLNVKAEIQALRGGSNALIGWLERKMEENI